MIAFCGHCPLVEGYGVAQAAKAPLLKGKSRKIVWHINLFGKKVKSSCFKTP